MTTEEYIENLTDLYLTKYPDTLKDKNKTFVDRENIKNFLLNYPNLYRRFLNNPEKLSNEYPRWFGRKLEKNISEIEENRKSIINFFASKIAHRLEHILQLRKEVDISDYNRLYYYLREINHDIQSLIIQNKIKKLREFKGKFYMFFESFLVYLIHNFEDNKKFDDRYLLANLEQSIKDRINILNQCENEAKNKKEEKIIKRIYEFGLILSEIAFQNGQNFEKINNSKAFYYNSSEEMHNDLIRLAFKFKNEYYNIHEDYIEQIDEFIKENSLF